MKRSKFNLTHLHSTTLDAGYLVPFLLQSTLPNDKFRIGLSTFIRAQPMLAPLMHEVELFTQYWYVPNRLVWNEWEEFITGGDNLSSSPVFPTVVSNANDAKVGSLWDYFGFPLQTGVEISALPFRALSLIWNARYRDEDLQNEVGLSFASGVDNQTNRNLLSPCIRKDYFSVARPYTQRGADIFVPITSGESSAAVFHKHFLKVECSPLNGSVNDMAMLNAMYEGSVLTSKSNLATPYNGTYSWATNPEDFRMAVADVIHHINISVLAPIIQAQILDKVTIDWADLFDKTRPGVPNYFKFALNNVVLQINQNVSLTFSKLNLVVRITLMTDETVPAMGANPAFSVSKIDKVANQDTTSGYAYKAVWLNYSGVGVAQQNRMDWRVPWYVQLNTSGALSVRDLREASALQRYAENSLKYGNRYEEFIQREFGISPRDSRIQRPEYLGGGRGILNISEVLQTAESTDSGVGTMRGHGVASITQRSIRFTSPEHGLIIGLLSIRPKLVYTSGVDREFLKRSRLDFFTPELSNIGMQEVLTQELYATSANKGSVFGYSDRYQEYRYHKPLVTGEFRGNLNFWNMAVEFASQPELNGEYVNMATYAENWKRPFQIQDDSAHAFVVMLKNHVRAYRPIPKRAKDILK